VPILLRENAAVVELHKVNETLTIEVTTSMLGSDSLLMTLIEKPAPYKSGFLRRENGTFLRCAYLGPTNHGTGESTTGEGGASIDDTDFSFLFRSHQPHVTYERLNPSGAIIRFEIGRLAVGPIAAEAVPERAARVTKRG
jgi:hypothetical protein